ncbi:MAG: hypothetical protein B6229_07000 [Spirochaetaceae bacterium 4572_7]|nr:MAG: hypothetical protein B6229_07000 [Spirochaetaceae bacterium 4572_7]
MIKLLKKELIQIGSESTNKDELLKEIADLAANECKKLSAKEIYTSLTNREKLSSTGLSQGIAIPHSMFDKLDQFYVGLIVIKEGIDFDSLDGEDSKLIFFSIGPKSQQNQHIATLTSISKLATDENLKNKLINAINPDQVTSLLKVGDDNKDKVADKKCQFVIHVQEEELFDDILEVLTSDPDGVISVIDAQTAGHYLHKLPLFSSFWNDVEDSFSKIIVSVINKKLMNETIRRINMVKGDDKSDISITVSDLIYFDGSTEY